MDTAASASTDVTAIHIGMGPPLTRDGDVPLVRQHRARTTCRWAHVMIAGICGGLDPDKSRSVSDQSRGSSSTHTSGTSYRHGPAPGVPLGQGKLITTEGVKPRSSS